MSKHRETVFVADRSKIDGKHKKVDMNGHTMHLINGDDGLSLYSSVCPHMGGKVEYRSDEFRCPLHGWRFKTNNGRCVNTRGEKLESYPVWEEDEKILAKIPCEDKSYVSKKDRIVNKEINLKLHSHACMEVECGEFSLLTDPWLKGNAFMGAWELFPPPITEPSDINPNAIWISHEHSDHFHLETLKQFSRKIPIYFPDFPNDRIRRLLVSEGFENVNPVPFGKSIGLGGDIKITCFEPKSMWNDSIVFIECRNTGILNLNDAGINDNVASIVSPVDVVCSTYTWGASGYPLTWKHLNEKEKHNIIQNSNQGSLEMLRQAADLYGANYVLPFAAHWVLWYPHHKKYLQKMRKNSLQDVVEAFSSTEVEVINIYPGESYSFDKKKYSRLWKNRDRLSDKQYIRNYVQKKYNENRFKKYHPVSESISKEEAQKYLLDLNSVPEMEFCEEINARIECVKQNKKKFRILFTVEDGILKLDDFNDDTDLKIKVPEGVLSKIIEGEMSWDEAHIGYWCEMSRSPDKYHFNFWRILQAPYYERGINPHGSPGDINLDRSISGIVEDYGAVADRILRRYGLYCIGCEYASQETVRDGARAHGLSDQKTSRLILELKQVLHGR